MASLEETRAMSREELVKTALYLADMEEVIKAMQAAAKLPRGVGGTLEVSRDDGEDLAFLWWDWEREEWLCNWLRGSGA